MYGTPEPDEPNMFNMYDTLAADAADDEPLASPGRQAVAATDVFDMYGDPEVASNTAPVAANNSFNIFEMYDTLDPAAGKTDHDVFNMYGAPASIAATAGTATVRPDTLDIFDMYDATPPTLAIQVPAEYGEVPGTGDPLTGPGNVAAAGGSFVFDMYSATDGPHAETAPSVARDAPQVVPPSPASSTLSSVGTDGSEDESDGDIDDSAATNDQSISDDAAYTDAMDSKDISEDASTEFEAVAPPSTVHVDRPSSAAILAALPEYLFELGDEDDEDED
ncbi:hypothetical protein HYPSUDRAFT_206708 [Hypholoma sublateritium FD-334 SS-4]|uniref:Uncharacterized protein n=1 Tax=Hypholoma sublateritium (strain FD-334 SS-4) TaxID=945553 RepID=A0A0D2P8X9_HYPSF|nr:hypothetical protein HYPSUDRAFT_206708 [Hypholoma sublateritium FD-334 SS-4]